MSAIYFKGQKYTGPTLNLGSGSLTTDDKTIVGGINEINSLYKVVVVEFASFSSLPQTRFTFAVLLSAAQAKETNCQS